VKVRRGPATVTGSGLKIHWETGKEKPAMNPSQETCLEKRIFPGMMVKSTV